MSVFNSACQLLQSATATEPGGNLSLRLATVSANTKYFVKVEQAAGTAFAVGAYELELVNTPNAARVNVNGSVKPSNDSNTNESIGSATTLNTPAGYAANTHYERYAKFNNSSDVDVYEFRSWSATVGVPSVASVAVWATAGTVAPRLTVYDDDGRAVPATVTAAILRRSDFLPRLP